jgi:hypothetical protein
VAEIKPWESGGFMTRLTAADGCRYPKRHGTGRRHPFDCRLRDFALALVALGVGTGGRLRVAMA